MTPCSISARSALRGNTLTNLLLSGWREWTTTFVPNDPDLSFADSRPPRVAHEGKHPSP